VDGRSEHAGMRARKRVENPLSPENPKGSYPEWLVPKLKVKFGFL